MTNGPSHADRTNLNESNGSVVTFEDSAKSGRIGEFLANARKKAKNVSAYLIVFEGKRKISKTTKMNQDNSLSAQEKQEGCKLGMDSHADISCIGRHARVLKVLEGKCVQSNPSMTHTVHSPILKQSMPLLRLILRMGKLSL